LKSDLYNKQQPYAIVIGLNGMTGLQTARILSSRGVPVIAIAKDPKHHVSRTRVCEEILYADTESEEVIEILVTLGPKLNQKAVLYPCGDINVALVSDHRQKLEEWYHIVLPDPEVLKMLMDKVSFYTYAQKNGFPIPPTYLLRTRSEAEEAAANLDYPCVLKPSGRSSEWFAYTMFKVHMVSSAEELLDFFDRSIEGAKILIAQQWVDGTDANLYSCNCYFSTASEPLVTFIARKIRQWPPQKGVSSLGVECRNDTVLEEALRLFQSVDYRGLGYLEMKQDARTGEYYIIEPNIGRPTGRSAIAEAGGVELLYTMYCDAIGWPLPPNREQKYTGVKWIHIRRDTQSALYYWRRGELTPKEWWQSVRGRKGYALFSWTDPGPFVGDLVRVVRSYLRPEERKEKAYLNLEPVKSQGS